MKIRSYAIPSAAPVPIVLSHIFVTEAVFFSKTAVVTSGHSDVAVLEQASRALLQRLESFDDTRDVSDNYDRGKAQLDLALRPEGRALGLTSSEVGQQVRDAFYGALALRQLRGTDEVEIRVKLPEEEREDVHFFEELVVRTAEGMEVPLLDVVDVEEGEAFTTITRRDSRRVVTVSTDVEPKSATTAPTVGGQEE